MSIVCGTDFSSTSWAAVEAAACIAARLKEPLHIVHALDLAERRHESSTDQTVEHWAHAHLTQQSLRLRRLVRDVQLHVCPGRAGDALLQVADHVGARLLVVGVKEARTPAIANVGHGADSLAQRALLPVLVVRDATPFVSWACSERPLRVLVSVNRSSALTSNLHWLAELERMGPVESTLLSLFSEPRECDRLGLSATLSKPERDALVKGALERELRQRAAEAATKVPERLCVEPLVGECAHGILEAERREQVDLLVIGSSSHRAGLWTHATSHDVLHAASCSVVCVPRSPIEPTHSLPRAERVLVATDFSRLGNAAVELATSVLAPAGTLHLLHVVDAATAPVGGQEDAARERRRQAALDRLKLLAPLATNVHTQLHVVDATDPAAAICQASERLDASIICMGAQGAGKLRRLVRGSTADGVLYRSTRPVLFARPAG